MKRLRVLAGLLLAAVLVCAGAIWAVFEALRPEAADVVLTERTRPKRIVRAVEGGAAPGVAEAGEPTLRVYGTVTDPDGTPIEGAEVGGWGLADTTDAAGAYEVTLVPHAEGVLVEAFGYDDRFVSFEVPEGAAEVPLDIVLTPNNELRVWCAGLPDDSCNGFRITCTSAWSPVGSACESEWQSNETVCNCPDGLEEVAVRGGGRSVLVELAEREAWLDFRDTGAIVGRVSPAPGEDRACRALAIRIPVALEDLPRGLFVGRKVQCEADGTFRLDGLVEGDWEVTLTSHAVPGSSGERVLVPRPVRPRAVVDVGTIQVPGGAVIEGIVLDGLTDAPRDEEMLLAWRAGAQGERVTVNGAESNSDGTFRIEGLPGGTWSVAPALAPQAAVTVTVAEEQTVRGLVVVTSEATALEENGFDLTEEDGRLVVEAVTPESPAWAAGLSPGDEVLAVRVAGFDVAGAMGPRANEFARGVLAYWDGPGITLVVRAEDGGEELVPLEW